MPPPTVNSPPNETRHLTTLGVVMPAQARIQGKRTDLYPLDSRFRGNDGTVDAHGVFLKTAW